MRVLGLIPARGGSKGIPRKNIRMLGGKPLIAWTIEAARKSRLLTRVILSTEDEEIAEVGRQWEVDVPFLRPRELAEDDTPTLPVVLHAVMEIEKQGGHYDAVCLLQPTAPFRKPEWIDACIQLMEKRGADASVTVCRIPAEHHPWWSLMLDGEGWLHFSQSGEAPVRRQDLPPAYYREGSVYVTRVQTLLRSGSLYGTKLAAFEVAADESVNLDTEEDWKRAEMLLERGITAR